MIFALLLFSYGAHGSAVGWGTTLQVERSRVRFPMVSLEFFIDIILPAALRLWGVDSASNRNEYQEYFLGVKAAGASGWHPYHLHVPIVLKSGSLNLLEPSEPVQACNGIALPLRETEIFALRLFSYGARGSAVGWGTTLQAGRSRVRFPMVSLEFFIDIIHPAALWPWGPHSL